MKNVLNLSAVLCLFAVLIFSSCGKENIITDADVAVDQTQKINSFLATNPSIEDAKAFFSSMPKSEFFSQGEVLALDELTQEQMELYNINLDTPQVTARACDDISFTVDFISGPNAFYWANDPTSGANSYIAFLMRGGSLLSYHVVNNQSGFAHLLNVPDCGDYTAHLWAKEVECSNSFQFLMSDSQNYPLCW